MQLCVLFEITFIAARFARASIQIMCCCFLCPKPLFLSLPFNFIVRLYYFYCLVLLFTIMAMNVMCRCAMCALKPVVYQ